MRKHLGEQRDQARVNNHHVVAGVGGDVADDFWFKPEVECVQDGTHRGDRQISLKVLGVVPHQRRYPLVAVDP